MTQIYRGLKFLVLYPKPRTVHFPRVACALESPVKNLRKLRYKPKIFYRFFVLDFSIFFRHFIFFRLREEVEEEPVEEQPDSKVIGELEEVAQNIHHKEWDVSNDDIHFCVHMLDAHNQVHFLATFRTFFKEILETFKEILETFHNFGKFYNAGNFRNYMKKSEILTIVRNTYFGMS